MRKRSSSVVPVEDNKVSSTDTTKDAYNIYAASPFTFHQEINSQCDNKKMSISFDELSLLASNGRLSNTDMEIMELLYNYRVLNRHNIEYALRNLSSRNEVVNKSSYKKNLSKLVSIGAVLRYYFYWNTKNEIKKTPCFYMLSPNVARFFRRKRNHRNMQPEFMLPDTVCILHLLIYNQFALRLTSIYADRIVEHSSYLLLKLKGVDFLVDGYFKLMCTNRISNEKNVASLVVIVIRRNPYWEEDYVTRLKLIYEYGKSKKALFHAPIILTICEDDLQIKEAFIAKENDEATRNIYCLYLTDIGILVDKPLEHIVDCIPIVSESTDTSNLLTKNNIKLCFICIE